MALSGVARFAPSPTGRIHLGTAASALVCWLEARSRGHRIVLRVEDNDVQRARAELVEPLLEDLRWLGLDWDEGPGCPGARGPYVQSLRGRLYQAALRQLEAAGLLYACTCSRADRRARGALPEYDGHCRDRGVAVGPLIDRLCDAAGQLTTSGQPRPALRWRMPAGSWAFVDGLLGPHSGVFPRGLDPILLRRDGVVAYQLAVVVDDLEMGISHVTRGADLLHCVPWQEALRTALVPGSPRLSWAHSPLLLDPAGRKLSKSLGSRGLVERRAAGESPELLVGWLAAQLGLQDHPEPTTPQRLLGRYDRTCLGRGPIEVRAAQM